jgi:hypothetical protein
MTPFIAKRIQEKCDMDPEAICTIIYNSRYPTNRDVYYRSGSIWETGHGYFFKLTAKGWERDFQPNKTKLEAERHNTRVYERKLARREREGAAREKISR